MPKIYPFQRHTGQYENWFAEHRWVYEAELRAVKDLLPESSRGLEVGVGTGRFAEPLGIKTGLEPFFSVDEVVKIMRQARFTEFMFRQTIFRNLSGVNENEPIKPGYGEGSFVVIWGIKKQI